MNQNLYSSIDILSSRPYVGSIGMVVISEVQENINYKKKNTTNNYSQKYRFVSLNFVSKAEIIKESLWIKVRFAQLTLYIALAQSYRLVHEPIQLYSKNTTIKITLIKDKCTNEYTFCIHCMYSHKFNQLSDNIPNIF